MTDTQKQHAILAPIEKQIEAYNEKNLGKFIDQYCQDVEVFRFPGKVEVQGRDELRNMFSDIFKQFPKALVDVTNRIISGQYVIDEELVSAGDGLGSSTAVAIYRVENNSIKQLWVLRDT